MTVIAAAPTSRPTGSLIGGALLGSISVAMGLALAYLTLVTPIASRLAPPTGGASSTGVILAIWSFALIAGGALVVAGTDQLASVVARMRRGRSRATPVVRMLRTLPRDVVVATGVVPHDGRPIPELVIGPFGAAVLHELPPRDTIRRLGEGWETRTPDGWRPSEDPLDRLARDAERVRRWLGHGDLDFVVRVYAALVAPDATIERSAACAVVTDAQIAPWLAALPRQRSFSVGRRSRIQAMVRDAVIPAGPAGATADRRTGVGW
jgi:hypothetical protein